MAGDRWIDLDGGLNVRDLGTLQTTDGRIVRPRTLLRSASLQELTTADVRRLVDDYSVRAVLDLRTGYEVASLGPGPLHREPLVEVHHLSLFVEPELTVDPSGARLLPWQGRSPRGDRDRSDSAGDVYFRYLDERPDAILQAMRLIAGSKGAVVVHCAAGKDRTGVVVAMALTELGVDRDEVVADYTLTAERIEAIIRHLAALPTYAGTANVTIDAALVDEQRPRPETMADFLTTMDNRHGGVGEWLRARGWTPDDATALRDRLLTTAG